MKKIKLISLISAVVTGVLMTSCIFMPQGQEKLDLSKMTLVWSEEFSGSKLNTDDWWYYTGIGKKEDTPTTENKSTSTINGPIFNQEVQNYVTNAISIVNDDDAEDGKALRITATNTSGTTWTSGKIQTSNKVDIKYGYIEARLKMPVAYSATSGGHEVDNNGVWPAFWMMPTDSVYGTWPRSGEIDIMEYSPSTSGFKAYATLHHASTKTDATDVYPSLGSKMINDFEYHTYGVRWTSGTIEAFFDGESLGTVYSNPGYDNWALWPYDQNYYVILNLAMGGNLGGGINPEMKRAEYDIDYIRYYK